MNHENKPTTALQKNPSMNKLISFTFAALLLAPLASLNAAELKLPAVFGDHMVLQRDKPVKVWGWADSVTNPAAVRYAWEDCQGQVNLIVNADGLPVSPFRTDRWVTTTKIGSLLDQQLLLPADGARPWADAGPDVLMLTKTKSITLDGSGSYSPDGTLTNYAWIQLSGPAPR